jgi:hypothetical protein
LQATIQSHSPIADVSIIRWARHRHEADDSTALLWLHGATAAVNPRLKYFQGKRSIEQLDDLTAWPDESNLRLYTTSWLVRAKA